MARKIVSALVAGLITTLGGLMAVITEMPTGAEVADIGSMTWLVIAVAGLLTAAKDVQTYLKNPNA